MPMRFPHRLQSRLLVSLLWIGAVALASSPALADVDVGIRGGYYTDVGEPFLGLDLLIPIADAKWFFNPNFEYVFVDPGDLSTLNLDVHYDFDTDQNDLFVWLGGGPAVIFRDRGGRHDDNETDIGLDLLGGIGWQLDAIVPYFQAKAIVSDDSEFVLAVGVRF
jgi:hypothetical protein